MFHMKLIIVALFLIAAPFSYLAVFIMDYLAENYDYKQEMIDLLVFATLIPFLTAVGIGWLIIRKLKKKNPDVLEDFFNN